MVLGPVLYGVSTTLTSNSSKGIKHKKGWTIFLKSFLFSEGSLYLERDYDLKNTLIYEGTNFTEGTMFLKPFLIPNGHFKPKGLYGLKNTL